ncbi:MAG TPA: hypothetical protein VFA97_08930 [Gaiellaceae bacterium]|nr:hypothetical protein [Gaiellaceae bacterium]
MKWHKGCGTSGRRPTSVGAALRRVRLLTATDAGIGLIETLIALLIFAVVSTALIGMLVSATTSTKVSKDQTIAEQGVASEIEMIKNWAATPDPNSNSSPTYDDIGTNPNGNPYGALPQSQVFTGVNGESLGTPAHMTISVSFASANVPGAYTNGIDYKKVTVTITRDVDSKVLSSATAFVAPPTRAAGNTATINATIADYDSQTGVPGAGLALGTGPSAPRSDTSDSLGKVTFAGLTANPTSGSQAYYDLTVTPPTGYQVLSDTMSPNAAAHFQLSPSQTYATTLYVYQPVTIVIALFNSDGSAYTGTASITVSSSPRAGSGTFTYAGTPLTITTLTPPNGELLVPGQTYTITVAPQTDFSGASSASVVPSGSPGYPSVLSQTFNLTMTRLVATPVNVTVSRSGTACNGAKVTLTGGPNNVNLSGSTSSTGAPVTFTNLPAASVNGPFYTLTGKSTKTNVSKTINPQTLTAGSNTINIPLGSGSSNC